MTKTSYFSREPTIRTEAQMREILAMRTRAKVAPEESGENAAPPDGAKPSPTPSPLLTWSPAVVHGDGSGFQTESSGRFSIVRERGDSGWLYRAFRRSPEAVMLSTHKTAQEAREWLQEHVRTAP